MVRTFLFLLLSFVLQIASGQSSSTIEILMEDQIFLPVKKITYSVSVRNNYVLSESIAPDDFEAMQIALQKKNTELFERYLANKKLVYQIVDEEQYNLKEPEVSKPSKEYLFYARNFVELNELLEVLKKLDFLIGFVRAVEFAQVEEHKEELWKKLFTTAAEKATYRASLAGKKMGKLLESRDEKIEIQKLNADEFPTDSASGLIKMTTRFRFELL